jgi:hypothetical protein
MTMLAEVIDAVIGIDTHRDSHEAEIADAAGRPITTVQVSNDSGGFAQLLATIATVVPDRQAARRTLSKTALAALAGRELPLRRAANRPSARPRSAASHRRWLRPGGSLRTTAPSCWPSSRTLPPA